MAGRHVDLDAAWEAITATQAAPTITIHGETHTLPVDKPVAVVLIVNELATNEGAVGYDRLVDVLGIVFGAGVVDRWVQDGIGKQKLVMLLRSLQGIYRPGGDGEGEAQPPATGETAPDSSTTSPRDGDSSAPTSTASTGSRT